MPVSCHAPPVVTRLREDGNLHPFRIIVKSESFMAVSSPGITKPTMMKAPRKLLVVDDEYSIRVILAEFLKAEGYHVTMAADGDEAIQLARRLCFDLVITDMRMPGRDGVETILTLRAEHPKLRIVAMSGAAAHAPGSFLPLAGKLGAARTLAKPFCRKELLEAVEEETTRSRTPGFHFKASASPAQTTLWQSSGSAA